MAFRTNKMPVLQEKSASGAVASFNTALAMPLASCNIAVNAWQEGSGDPNPIDNIRPIHGFSEVNPTRLGKNVWGNGVGEPDVSDLYNGWRLRYSTNARIVFFDKDTSQDISGIYFGYTMTGKDATGGSRWAIVNGTVRPNDVVTSIHHYISVYPASVSTLERLFNRFYVMVVIDNATYDTYEPYVTPTIYTIQLGQDVYGAEVDVVNGVAHVTHAYIVLDETVEPNYVNWRPNASSVAWTYPLSVANVKKYGGNVMPNVISDKYATVTYYQFYSGTTNQISVHTDGTYGLIVRSTDTSLTTKNAILAYLEDNPIQVVYELATPFDIQLTPTQIETLIGNNTIFADTGDVDLTFKDLDIAKRGNFREVFKLPS